MRLCECECVQMGLYQCVYTCTNACICVQMHANVCKCVYMSVNACKCVQMRLYVCTYVHMRVNASTCVYVRNCLPCLCAYMYMPLCVNGVHGDRYHPSMSIFINIHHRLWLIRPFESQKNNVASKVDDIVVVYGGLGISSRPSSSSRRVSVEYFYRRIQRHL